MCKREQKSFKEYAQRWRDLAAEVAPPMMEREMITMIVDTLYVFYYEKMVGYMSSSFADLVFTGERIKVGLRRGKFDHAASTSSGNRRLGAGGAKKKEGDALVMTAAPTWPSSPQTPHNPMYQYSLHQYNYLANIDSPLAQRPSDRECLINHKDLPNITHKIHSLHSLDQVQIPTPIQTPT